MSDLSTPEGREELRREIAEYSAACAKHGARADSYPVTISRLLTLLDQADAGERLALACEKLIERGGAGEDERWWKPWDDAVAEAEAAIAAFRSPPPPARAAEETTENRK